MFLSEAQYTNIVKGDDCFWPGMCSEVKSRLTKWQSAHYPQTLAKFEMTATVLREAAMSS